MTAKMPKPIAEAIVSIMEKVDYVQKKGENKFHNYKFAAVGDILAKLQPAMAETGLSVVQHEVSHALIADAALMTATYEFILSHKNGDTWEERPRHTGMAGARNTKGGFDDKALNKCHTAARKYFLLSLFQIPTGDVADPDADDDREDTGGKTPPPPPPPKTAELTPEQKANNWVAQAKDIVASIQDRFELNKWIKSSKAAMDKLELAFPDKYQELQLLIDDKFNSLPSGKAA